MLDNIRFYWDYIQDLLSVDGGLYVDFMCVAVIIRLLAVLWRFPPMSNAEAGLWGVTIATYGYTTKGGKPS